MDADILERINRGIILRTGAYLTNDHFVLSSGRHTQEYVEKALATTEPAFTEGLGDVIAKHFAEEPIDLVLTTGYGASLLGHCVARAHPVRPRFIYANKQRNGSGVSQVTLPREFRQYFVGNPRVLIVEDIVTTGETVKGLIKLVKSLGGTVVGIGTLWRRVRKVNFKSLFFYAGRSGIFDVYPEGLPDVSPGDADQSGVSTGTRPAESSPRKDRRQLTVVPRTNNLAKRFPTVETVTVEWNAYHRPGEGLSPEGGAFSHAVQASTGEVEPLLPCSHPGCQGGGFEILEAVESMVSDRLEDKAGLLVCIGWERTKDGQTEQSPCTQVISYRITLTYRKKDNLSRNSKRHERNE